MIDETWGTWADRDCLLVRTPGFALVFERGDGVISAALSRVETGDETVIFDTRALALADIAGCRMVLKARDPEAGEDPVFDNDVDHELELVRTELNVAVTGEGLVLGVDGRPVERLVGERLELVLPSGRPATLARLERIVGAAPRPGTPVEVGKVARCLQAWALGTGLFRDPEGTFRSFTIGTNRLSFDFSFGAIGDDDILHCRAARVRATEEGAVFAPVLRLFARAGQVAASVVPDIAAAAAADLAPDPAGFDFDAPAPGADEGDELRPEWWRLCGADPDGLDLESRSGGRYRLARPMPDNPALLEWFAELDYQSAGASAG